MKLKFTLFMLMMAVAFTAYTQGYNLKVNSPASVAGDYSMLIGGFGQENCDFTTLSGDLEIVIDGTGGTEACDVVTNDLTGKIAIIDRGTCNFSIKCYEAQKQGAIAAIVCNNQDTNIFTMAAGTNAELITIPCFMMSRDDCATIRIEIPGVNTTIEKDVLEDPNADDVVVWGNIPGDGDFDGGFNGWTALSNSCSGGTMGDDGALWQWFQDGFDDRGSFGTADIFSFTPCNGVAIFNSDYLDNEGDAWDPVAQMAIQANLADGECVAPQDGELISPVIDLSNAGITGTLGLKFVQAARQLNTSEFIVSWSTDGGTTWTDRQLNTDLGGNASLNNIQRIPMVGVNGSSDLSNLRIRFKMLANYYYWVIDDVQIIEFSDIDAELVDVFFSPVAYAFPQSQADGDTIFWSATIFNNGGVNLANVQFNIEVVKESSGEVIYTDSEVFSDIGIGQRDTVALSTPFPPVGLDLGVYLMNYSLVVQDETEDDISDNNFTYKFEVTDNYFAKEDGPQRGLRPSGNNAYVVATSYIMSPNVPDVVAGEAVFAVEPDMGSLTDNYAQVILAKLNDGLDYTNVFSSTDIFNNPGLTNLFDDFYVFTDEADGELVSAPLSLDGAGTPLEPGSAYMLMVSMDDGQVGSALSPNKDLGFYYNDDNVDNWDALLTDDTWFSGYVGNPAPVLRLVLFIESATDDTPLPEHVFRISPNPASDHVIAHIDFEQPTNMNLMVADMEGRIISMKDYNNVTKQDEKVDVSNLANGTYLIRVSTLSGTKTQKLIVQH